MGLLKRKKKECIECKEKCEEAERKECDECLHQLRCNAIYRNISHVGCWNCRYKSEDGKCFRT